MPLKCFLRSGFVLSILSPLLLGHLLPLSLAQSHLLLRLTLAYKTIFIMSAAKRAPVNQNLKNLKIKTGTCNRCVLAVVIGPLLPTTRFLTDCYVLLLLRLMKDLRVYTQEEQQQTDKIAKMREANADPYDIKQQVGTL